MTFRYDDARAAAQGIDPGELGLLGYNGTNWVVIPTTLDATNKILTTSASLPSFYHDFAIAEVPEPSTFAMLLAGIGIAIVWWRRKRTAA